MRKCRPMNDQDPIHLPDLTPYLTVVIIGALSLFVCGSLRGGLVAPDGRRRDQILQGNFGLAELPLFNLYIARERVSPANSGQSTAFTRATPAASCSHGHHGELLALLHRLWRSDVVAVAFPVPRRFGGSPSGVDLVASASL